MIEYLMLGRSSVEPVNEGFVDHMKQIGGSIRDWFKRMIAWCRNKINYIRSYFRKRKTVEVKDVFGDENINAIIRKGNIAEIESMIERLRAHIKELDGAPMGENIRTYSTDTIEIQSDCNVTELYQTAYFIFEEVMDSLDELADDFVTRDKVDQDKEYTDYVNEPLRVFRSYAGEAGITKIGIADFLVMYNDKSLADLIIRYYEKFLIDIKRLEKSITDTATLNMVQAAYSKVMVITEKIIKSLTVDMDVAYDKYKTIFNNLTAEVKASVDRESEGRRLRKQRAKLEKALL